MKHVFDSGQQNDTTSHSTSIGASLSDISLTDMNVKRQVAVTDPHKSNEEGQNHLKYVSDSVQHNNTTSHSSFIGASLSDIALMDMNVHSKTSVAESNRRSQNYSSHLINCDDCKNMEIAPKKSCI